MGASRISLFDTCFLLQLKSRNLRQWSNFLFTVSYSHQWITITSITYVSWNHIYGWLKTTRDRLHKRFIKSLFRYYLDQGIKSQIRVPWILWCCREGNCRVGSSLWFCYQTPTWHAEQSAWARYKDDPQNFRPQREKERTYLVLIVLWVLRGFTPRMDFQCVGREHWLCCDGPALSTDLATSGSVTVGILVPLDPHVLISEWGAFIGWYVGQMR